MEVNLLVSDMQNGITAHKSIHTSQKASCYFSITVTEWELVKPASLSIDRSFPLSEEGSCSHFVFTGSDVTPGNESPGMSPGLLLSKLLACSQVNTHFLKVKQYFSVTGNKEGQSTPADLLRDFPLSEEVSHSHGACTDSDVASGSKSAGK